MNTKIKCLFGFAVSCLAAFALISVIPSHGEERVYENLIRLHVIANSDTAEDQTLKLSVRDAVLEKMKEIKENSKDETEKSLEESRDELISVCTKTLEESGCDDKVDIILGKEKYPVRYYDDFSLPAGEYTSLRVVIGEGEGHNWWCVLYPPLCTSSSEAECEEEYLAAGFTGDEYRLIKKNSGVRYKVKFKFLEILSEAFGFER